MILLWGFEPVGMMYIEHQPKHQLEAHYTDLLLKRQACFFLFLLLLSHHKQVDSISLYVLIVLLYLACD